MSGRGGGGRGRGCPGGAVRWHRRERPSPREARGKGEAPKDGGRGQEEGRSRLTPVKRPRGAQTRGGGGGGV